MSIGLGNYKIIGIGLVCIACGAILGELIDHAIHGRFKWFLNNQPVQVGLTIPVTVAMIYFLWRQINIALESRKLPPERQEKPGVTHGFTGFGFKTTPFIRAAAYFGFYLLGILLNFIS